MACFDMVWDVVITQEGISAVTAGRNFIITGIIYYVWAHGYSYASLTSDAANRCALPQVYLVFTAR